MIQACLVHLVPRDLWEAKEKLEIQVQEVPQEAQVQGVFLVSQVKMAKLDKMESLDLRVHLDHLENEACLECQVFRGRKGTGVSLD